MRYSLALLALAWTPLLWAQDDPVTVSESITIDAPTQEVWAAIGDFGNLHGWHPAVATTEVVEGTNDEVGAIRKLTLGDGALIMETLEDYSAPSSYRYSMQDTVLPVADYEATITVAPEGETMSTITWEGTFKPTSDDAESVIQGIYQAGLDNLKSTLE